MRITELFTFGKYSGLSVKQVYQGSDKINNDLIKKYLLYKIENPSIIDSNEEILTEIFKFEISDTIFRATPIMDDFKGNWKISIEKLFRDSSNWTDRLIGNKSLDDFNTKIYSEQKNEPEITGGNPEYIEWCIKNVEDFMLDPEELIELQKLEIYRFKGIEVIHKIDDIYEYKPKIIIEKFQFSEQIFEINNKKYEDSIDIEEDYSFNDYDNDYDERTYENYNGSYAQDVEGWSDQDIDDALDGAPDAYWNID
ncbi:MAG: hypothetical protein PWQ17_2270 [Anaerophaga sp.]|nr:hypothetical protein [Anaerophaga sp.]